MKGLRRRQDAPPPVANGSRRKHHWLRWTVLALVVLVAVGAVGLSVELQPSPPPLALPAAAPRPPLGPLDGTWTVGSGSVAGFRLQESILGLSNAVVGRTDAVSGDVVVSGNRVTRATFRINLATVKVGAKTAPQLARSLDTERYPSATFTLSRPMALSPAFLAGATINVISTGQLAMRGTSHLVTFHLAARRDGTGLQAAGSMPVAFSGWAITGPKGYGFFGSLANHGVAEFLLVLHRQ